MLRRLSRSLALIPCWLALGACGVAPAPADATEAELFEDGSKLAEPRAAPRGFFFVVDAAGPLIVVDRDPPAEWGSGPIELVDPGAPETGAAWTVTRRAVSAATLPDELGALVGRHVILHGEEGERCTAAIGELELTRRTDFWEPAEPETDALGSAWDAASSRVVLAGRAQALEGHCAGASFATLADDPPPRVFPARSADEVDASGALADAAIAALRSLAAYSEIAAQYHFDVGPGLWEHHGGASPSVAYWSAGPRTFVGVDASVPGACGEFASTLWALWELRDGALLERAASQSEPFPSQLLDVDRDGRLELLSGSRLLLPAGSELSAIDVEVPFYGCPC